MNDKIKKFLETIGINEDYVEYFLGSNIEKVLIDKKSSRFHFIMGITDIIDTEVYDDLLECLKDAFSYDISWTLKYDGDDYSKVSGYLNKIIEEYSRDSIRYGVFRDRELVIDGRNVKFLVFNRVEEMNINSKVRDITNRLKEYGFSNINFDIKYEEVENTELINKIEEEKNIDSVPVYTEKKQEEKNTKVTHSFDENIELIVDEFKSQIESSNDIYFVTEIKKAYRQKSKEERTVGDYTAIALDTVHNIADNVPVVYSTSPQKLNYMA